MTLILPIQGGKAQSTDTPKIQRLEKLNHEVDSIRVQQNLYLDLLEYQLHKDTFKEKPTKE